MEKGKLSWRGKTKIKFPSLADFLWEKVPSRAATLREIIIGINCMESEARRYLWVLWMCVFKFLNNNSKIQWKPLIMITLGPALFDNNNRLITLSGGYNHLHYLTQFIVTTFYMYKKQQNLFKNLCNVACCLFAFSSSWMNCSYS